MNLDAIEYRNAPERFSEFRKKLLLIWAGITTFSLAISAVMFFYTGNNDFAGSVTIPLIYFLFILVVLMFSMFRSLRQQKAIYLSYKLIIDEQALSREQSNFPPVKIPFKEIAEIRETKAGHIVIKGVERHQLIAISPLVENFEQLKSKLSNVHQFSKNPALNTLQKYPAILPLLAIGSMVTLYVSTNRFLAAAGGIICLAMMIWSFYKIRTAPVMDKKLSRLSWWLIVVFLSIAAGTYVKLFPIN